MVNEVRSKYTEERTTPGLIFICEGLKLSLCSTDTEGVEPIQLPLAERQVKKGFHKYPSQVAYKGSSTPTTVYRTNYVINIK